MKLIKIPRNLFQTWEIKELTPEMNLLTSSWKINNPNYAYFLFDDAERKQFIKNSDLQYKLLYKIENKTADEGHILFKKKM